MESREYPQEPVYGWSHSADTALLISRADILGVSPRQLCLVWTKVPWLTDSHFGWQEWLHSVLYTLCYRDGTKANCIGTALFNIYSSLASFPTVTGIPTFLGFFPSIWLVSLFSFSSWLSTPASILCQARISPFEALCDGYAKGLAKAEDRALPSWAVLRCSVPRLTPMQCKQSLIQQHQVDILVNVHIILDNMLGNATTE